MSASIAQAATIARACDPRVGDQIIGPGSCHVTTVVRILPLDGLGHQSPDLDLSIGYTLTGSDKQHECFLRQYQWMARCAIEAGENFHAVEDDEDE